MKIGDAEYDALVAKLREKNLHKVTQMSEAETQGEIARINEGAKSSFEDKSVNFESPGLKTPLSGSELDVLAITMDAMKPKKRGRPKGSKNKSKAK